MIHKKGGTSMKQIVCLSHSPWRTRPNRTQQILTRLSDTQVLFFEPPARGREQDHSGGLRVRSNVVVYSLPAPPGTDPSLSRRRSQAKVADFIIKVMRQRRFQEPMLWCTSPEYTFLINHLAYRCLVYDCQREWDALPLEWESELAIAADVVFAASPGLVERLTPCSDNIALLPNGANPQMFFRDGLTPPADLVRLPQPIFARVGDVFADMELEPMMFAAREHPEWTFLLIGRMSRRALQALSPLPNVVFAGAVPAVELPDYLTVSGVLFDLLRTSRRSSDVIPGRIYEYFSTGKPVVAMVEPRLPDPFPDVIYTAYDGRGFLRACQDALREQGGEKREKRLTYARDASWSGRAREVDRILGTI